MYQKNHRRLTNATGHIFVVVSWQAQNTSALVGLNWHCVRTNPIYFSNSNLATQRASSPPPTPLPPFTPRAAAMSCAAVHALRLSATPLRAVLLRVALRLELRRLPHRRCWPRAAACIAGEEDAQLAGEGSSCVTFPF